MDDVDNYRNVHRYEILRIMLFYALSPVLYSRMNYYDMRYGWSMDVISLLSLYEYMI